ncbi:hypothetical protein MTsPCn9_25340 [Croceitalea sp. MTPC9]|uniref:hypothetical protein n=1 Tax=unclassified Croceitalea TaxID=2632280 RepID=UPI002B37BF60|nr:hypothetical protein MTsPCn6_29190 [Croceitalea sp. MTPC6]GMN17596.1 hypothetical protein MTsPCn9_25340 [Croceitalea sp. MTPC9]
MQSEKNEFKDDFIEAIANNAERKELSKDFEKNLMDTIRLRNEFKKEIASKLRTSLYCFMIAMALVFVYLIIMAISKFSAGDIVGILPIITLFMAIGIAVVVSSNYNRVLHKTMV